jgi:hydrogenase-4 component F
MAPYIPLFFILPPLLAGLVMVALGGHRLGQNNRLLSWLAGAQAFICLALSLWVIFGQSLPLFYMNGQPFMIDQLAIFEVFITSLVFLLAAIYARGYVAGLLEAGELDSALLRLFYGTLCLLELVTVLGFFSNNLALLWIFAELGTLFSAVLVVSLKARENIVAALKYVFVTSTAMLFAFIGIIILFALSRQVIDGGSLNLSSLLSSAALLDEKIFTLAFAFLFIGFAAKAGVAPFHTWVPSVYIRAPSVVAVVSVTVLNLALYAILRLYVIGYHAGAGSYISVFLFSFGLLSLAAAGLSMLARTNTKKLIAFSGVENMGLLLIAIGLGSPVALFWVLFHQLGYTLVKTLLFFCAGIFHRQYQSNKYFMVHSPFKLQPLASWGLILGASALAGAPALPVFLAKWNILSELAGYSVPLLSAVLVLVLLAAVGIAWYFIRVFGQPPADEPPPYRPTAGMKLGVVLTLAMIILLGLYMPPALGRLLTDIVSGMGF